MASLSETASQRLDKIKRRGTLPSWWLLLQIACGVALFLFLAYRAISGGSDSVVAAPPTASDAPWATVVELDDETSTDAGTDAPTEGDDEAILGEGALDEPLEEGVDVNTLPETGSTAVDALDETAVDVPNAALNVARDATLAKFTGEYAGVAILPGVEPAAGSVYPEATLDAPIVVTYREGAYTLSFAVDVDGSGADVRRVPTTVVLSDDAWVWAGN